MNITWYGCSLEDAIRAEVDADRYELVLNEAEDESFDEAVQDNTTPSGGQKAV